MGDFKVKFEELAVEKLQLNEGQLEGLPKNPRFIKDERFEALKKSIEDAPEMLKLRGLIVYPMDDGNYIIIAGNMRYRACKELNYATVPSVILPKETTIEKLKQYAIKDNVPFGQIDWDLLANDDWDIDELQDWGLECDFLKAQEDFDFDDADDLSEKTYKEPEKTFLECPCCHHRDSVNHFKKVSSLDESEEEETEEVEDNDKETENDNEDIS